jgi:hypothetical protein
MTLDPYLLKRYPKWHPKRLRFTAKCWLADRYSRKHFDEYAIPFVDPWGASQSIPAASWSDTQVTPLQSTYLLRALQAAEAVPGCVVEVGSWRGVTTRYLASATESLVVGIDPFIGPLNEVNLRKFEERTASLPNVKLRRQTFGEAIRGWADGFARFVFIDAAHDYANVSHDLGAAQLITAPGAIIALHDTDDAACAGCRRAVYEQLERFELIVHIPNLVVLRRPTSSLSVAPVLELKPTTQFLSEHDTNSTRLSAVPSSAT